MKKHSIVSVSIYLLCTFASPVYSVSAQTTDPDPSSMLPTGKYMLPGGWTNLTAKYLVTSDGTRSLGNPKLIFNTTRDQGSKIVFFNSETGNNEAAQVYWWNGTNIIDSDGGIADENGLVYGTDPLHPNEDAIKPFLDMSNAKYDDRLETQQNDTDDIWRTDGMAGGYPDWFLFKRGQLFTDFNEFLHGGRSEEEPMVVAAYGQLSDGRAIFQPMDVNFGTRIHPFKGANAGHKKEWFHMHVSSIQLNGTPFCPTYIDFATSFGSDDDAPLTLVLEDMKFFHYAGDLMNSLPRKTLLYRSMVSHSYSPDGGHISGYHANGEPVDQDGDGEYDADAGRGWKTHMAMQDVIFYKNGFLTDPLTEAVPRYDSFSRNIYQGGGARMGNSFRNIITADGGSGSPQMRSGGTLENSLIVEGYFYTNTESNSFPTPWLAFYGQEGRSAVIRNNVQQILRVDDGAGQPGMGFEILGVTWGGLIEGNIISGASLYDELNMTPQFSFQIQSAPDTYGDTTYYQKDNTIRNNILYDAYHGLLIQGDFTEAQNNKFENNVIVGRTPLSICLGKDFKNFDEDHQAENTLISSSQLEVQNNRIYHPASSLNVPSGEWIHDNTYTPVAGELSQIRNTATVNENWPAPNRTVKKYVQEVLGLTLLDWADDPYVDKNQAQEQINNNTPYDPIGLKTFMAVALNMRHGGADPIPSSGKPSMTGDYPWDVRFTGQAVVNWIREGFNLPPVGPVDDNICGDVSGDADVDGEDLILALQILAGINVTPNLSGDCNADQVFDMVEVLNILDQMK